MVIEVKINNVTKKIDISRTYVPCCMKHLRFATKIFHDDQKKYDDVIHAIRWWLK